MAAVAANAARSRVPAEVQATGAVGSARRREAKASATGVCIWFRVGGEAYDQQPMRRSARTLAIAENPRGNAFPPIPTAARLPAMTTQVTVDQLKSMIVQKLNLKGVSAESLGDDDPLFGQGLGLDSVDALELVLAIESEYGIQIQDAEVGKEAFASARVLCAFLNARLAGEAAPRSLTPGAPREQGA